MTGAGVQHPLVLFAVRQSVHELIEIARSFHSSLTSYVEMSVPLDHEIGFQVTSHVPPNRAGSGRGVLRYPLRRRDLTAGLDTHWFVAIEG